MDRSLSQGNNFRKSILNKVLNSDLKIEHIHVVLKIFYSKIIRSKLVKIGVIERSNITPNNVLS